MHAALNGDNFSYFFQNNFKNVRAFSVIRKNKARNLRTTSWIRAPFSRKTSSLTNFKFWGRLGQRYEEFRNRWGGIRSHGIIQYTPREEGAQKQPGDIRGAGGGLSVNFYLDQNHATRFTRKSRSPLVYCLVKRTFFSKEPRAIDIRKSSLSSHL